MSHLNLFKRVISVRYHIPLSSHLYDFGPTCRKFGVYLCCAKNASQKKNTFRYFYREVYKNTSRYFCDVCCPQLGPRMCISGPCWTRTHGQEFEFGGGGEEMIGAIQQTQQRNGRSAHFFLDYSDSCRTLVKRHTWAHSQLPQKVIRIDNFPSSMMSRNIVAPGGKEGGGVGASEEHLQTGGNASTFFSEDCKIDTQHNLSNHFFKLLTLYLHFQVFFGISCLWDSQECPNLRVRSGRVRNAHPQT